MIDNKQKRNFKKDYKRRMIEICVSIPVGIGFAFLFWWLNLGVALQLFLTVVCWGAFIGIVELIFWLINRSLKKKLENKPKRRDPFAD